MRGEGRTKQQLIEELAAMRRRIAELEGSGAQRKQAEETPGRGGEPYRALFEGIPVGLYRAAPEGRILYANQALVELLGYPDRQSLMQVDVRELYVDPEDRERQAALLQQEGPVHGFELRFRRYDGSVIWVRHSGRIGRESGDRPAYYEGALEDISEQKRAEEALRKSEAQYRSLVEQSHDPIYLLYDRKFEFINERFEELFGVTQEEVRAPDFDFMTLVAPQSRPLIEARMNKLATGEEVSPRYEFTALNADGNAIEVEVSVSYVPYRDGVATQGVLRDVTERKRAEARVRHLNAVLQAIRDVNQLLVREKDRDRLLQGTCDLLDERGYHTAWMALVDESGDLVTAVEAGLGEDFAALVEQLEEGEWPRCAQEALMEPGAVATRDPLSLCVDCPVRAHHEGTGAMTVRVEHEGRIYGLLSVSVLSDLALTEEETVLFEEVAGDIAFGLHNLEMGEQRREAQEALRESEERFQTLFEFAPDGYYVSDLKGTFLDGNRATEEIMGYDRQELIGKNLLRAGLLTTDQAPRAAQLLAENASGKPTGPDEFTLTRKDGSRVPVEIRTHPTHLGGEPVVLGIARDITERKQAEEALREQLARTSLLNEIARAIAARQDLESIFRVVAQQLEDDFADLVSIWVRDSDSHVFTAAAYGARFEEAAAKLGLPKQLAIPFEQTDLRPFLEGKLVYIADLAELDLPIVEPWAAFGVRSAVVAPLTREGRVFAVVVGARRESKAFSSAECEFFAGLSKHVSLAARQAQLHRDLRAAYDDLRQTQRAMMQQERLRALGEMASGIAHDINNAISPVPLYAALIEQEAELSDQGRKYLRVIRRAIDDVAETVGRMRQFYAERGEEQLQPIDVNQAAVQAIELTRPLWRDVPHKEGITVDLQTDFQEDLPPVMGNQGEIRQAVTNLILNAVDAMPDGGVLSLRTRVAAGAPAHLMLEVSDTGIGMDEETQERCFEPFFSTKGERGTGMGLATVYGMMQRHGGAVAVDSAPGEGTTVRLIFPARQLAEEGAAEEVPAPASPLRILCIDDERLLREALKEALQGEGHTVELADGGELGLEAFREAQLRGEPFDVVITDLGMPYVGGRHVARMVKQEALGTPVILLTGWGVRLGVENAASTAADLILSKPPTIEALNRALARVVSGD